MQSIKNKFKSLLGIHTSSGVKPLWNLEYIGSKYHGYYVPRNFLNEQSICYCIGAGEDISFDTELKVMYNSKVFIFDPAPEGKLHFERLKELTSTGQLFSIGVKDAFTYRISKEQLNDISYNEIGIWDKPTILKFYDPQIENYASHSVELFKETGEYIELPVDRLNNIMKHLRHNHVDLVKMEIEGAEYTVLDTIVKDKLDVKVILVEFDEVFHAKGFRHLFRIKKSTNGLRKAGYILVHSTDHFKRTFVRKDVFKQLKANESKSQNK